MNHGRSPRFGVGFEKEVLINIRKDEGLFTNVFTEYLQNKFALLGSPHLYRGKIEGLLQPKILKIHNLFTPFLVNKEIFSHLYTGRWI